MKQRSIIDEPYEIELPCIRVRQPLGEFFVASIDSRTLRQITYSDVRRLTGEREVDTYLGIQREVDPKRVKELEKYVNTVDACFPTSVILAVPEECAEFDPTRNILKLSSVHDADGNPIISRVAIAKVLDGQHRIEGLRALLEGKFEVNVSIFVDMDIANQAYLFSTVNLAQTKVKKSLVYDLFEYSRSRSPQKSAHNIAVALDRASTSPLHGRIKRLGSATPGRSGETLTQATFVESLMSLISKDAVVDRDLYKRGKTPPRASPAEADHLVFRNLFLDEEDDLIADILMAYFDAVSAKWHTAWSNTSAGYMLGKTNGFKSLMRLLRPAYVYARKSGGGTNVESYSKLLSRSTLKDEDFVVKEFLPGTGGEAALFKKLRDELFSEATPTLL